MLDTLDISVILLVILYHAVLYVAVKKMIDVAMIRSYVVVTTQDYLKKLQDAVESGNLLETLLDDHADDNPKEP